MAFYHWLHTTLNSSYAALQRFIIDCTQHWTLRMLRCNVLSLTAHNSELFLCCVATFYHWLHTTLNSSYAALQRFIIDCTQLWTLRTLRCNVLLLTAHNSELFVCCFATFYHWLHTTLNSSYAALQFTPGHPVSKRKMDPTSYCLNTYTSSPHLPVEKSLNQTLKSNSELNAVTCAERLPCSGNLTSFSYCIAVMFFKLLFIFVSELFKMIALNFFRRPYVNALVSWKRRAWGGSPTLGAVQFCDKRQYRCIEII